MPRVAVVLDGSVIPRWISYLLSELRAAEFADVVLLLVAAPPPVPPARRELRGLLFSLYEATDYRAFRSSPDALEPVDAAEQFESKTPVLELATTSSRDAVAAADLDAIASYDPDVGLWLAETEPRGSILRSFPDGVWKLHHGDPVLYRGGPPFFWELHDGETATRTVLEDYSARTDRPAQIYSSWSAIHPQSLYQSRNSPYWKGTQFMLRRLEQLAAEGQVSPEPGPSSRTADVKKPRGVPSNSQMVTFLVRLLARGLRSRLRRLVYRERWYLAERLKRAPAGADLGGFEIHPAPRGVSAADPFVVSRDGRHHVFFEELEATGARGEIAHFEILEDGSTTPRTTVLTRSYHLSYPFVFEHDGEMYMLPETAANRAIELYRAEAFPAVWQFERTLLSDLTAVDPTLLEYEGRLWLFANVKEYGAPYSDELCIFFADSLEGPWTPHPRNPVVSDVRSARPAGRIFVQDGALIRPGQDSSGRYGRAVSLNRIDVLTDDAYRETPVARIDPDWRPGNLGTHTYNFDDVYEVIDGREWERRFAVAVRTGASRKPARRPREQAEPVPGGDR